MDCFSCSNEQCIIRSNINSDAIKPFLVRKTNLSCKKGQHFIIEGAPVHGLYFVREGIVKVAKTGINGKEQIIRITGSGEIIGHRGFAAGNFYQISALALENTTLCNFSTDTLNEMLLCNPKLTFDLMTFYAEELNRSEGRVKKFAQMTVREKVIDALLYLNRKFGQINGILKLQLSRSEIADLAGTTEEQVIRVISALKKEGLIKATGKKIGIENVDILRKEIASHNYHIQS